MHLLQPEYAILYSFITAVLISLIMIPRVARVAKAKNIVAMPNGRTSHDGAIPTMGGVAIFGSLVMGTGLWLPGEALVGFQYVIPALVIILFFGMKDDMVGINARKKLLGQIFASLLVIMAADIRLTTLYGAFGIHQIPYVVSVVITLFIFLLSINAYNLIDGIDGLASGMGILISLLYGAAFLLLGEFPFAALTFSLAGSLLVFFIFNVFGKKNKLFMGDTGSLTIGFIFAILAVKIATSSGAPGSIPDMRGYPIVAFSLLLIPICDTLRVIVSRFSRRVSPFHAERTHCHHDLLRLGFTHLQASLILIGLALLLFIVALMLRNFFPLLLGIIMVGTGMFVTNIPNILLRLLGKKI
jgi:UDP-GlcNAc:undecaprenyl-phosphate GlcNAc-1-phosphate transferase